MSNFTPLVKTTYEFDGDTIQVWFSRLNRKDMLKILPSFAKIQQSKDDAEKGDEMSVEYVANINDVLNEVAELIPKYIRKFEGLNDTDGKPITIETVVDEMYFSTLLSELIIDIIKQSGVPSGKE